MDGVCVLMIDYYRWEAAPLYTLNNLVPSYNVESIVSDSNTIEYVLFIVPNVIKYLKPSGSQLKDLTEQIKRMEEKLNEMSRNIERTSTTNASLSKKIETLQKETESLK
jgi:peptidoglycan hydrolase CwlO-like protein